MGLLLMSHKMGEQRKNKRFSSQGNLQAEVVSCESYPELTGKNISCESINISADGIQVILKEHAPVGAVLDVWVSVPKSKKKTYHLVATICWIKRTKDETAYRAGLDVSSSDKKDLEIWFGLGFPEKHS
ncbi:MAG: PilZ domain-containing protein [Gammaproteobacteria bacterium]|nr:PilZ domain-containing protein [Gammaproteobacteria bacterium]